jgi:hypothetical protein
VDQRPYVSAGFSYPPPQSPDQSPIEQSPFYRGRTGVLALVVCLLLLLGAVIVYFDVVPIVSQGDAQAAAVRQFCGDQVHQDYTAAYSLLASDYTKPINLDPSQFAQTLQQRDQRYGPVRACAIIGRDYVRTFASTAFGEIGFVFQITVTLDEGSHAGNITVMNDHGWKIRYLDAQLHLDG